jgi:hypothetical protein
LKIDVVSTPEKKWATFSVPTTGEKSIFEQAAIANRWAVCAPNRHGEQAQRLQVVAVKKRGVKCHFLCKTFASGCVAWMELRMDETGGCGDRNGFRL